MSLPFLKLQFKNTNSKLSLYHANEPTLKCSVLVQRAKEMVDAAQKGEIVPVTRLYYEEIFFEIFFSIALGWSVAYLLVWILRWIMRGFGYSETHFLPDTRTKFIAFGLLLVTTIILFPFRTAICVRPEGQGTLYAPLGPYFIFTDPPLEESYKAITGHEKANDFIVPRYFRSEINYGRTLLLAGGISLFCMFVIRVFASTPKNKGDTI